MGSLASKSESKVNPSDNSNNDKSPTKPPPGALGSQGRGMSISRLALSQDLGDSDSDDGKMDKEGSRSNVNDNNNKTPSTNKLIIEKEHHQSSEKKNKDIGYWYFDIGASMKNRSWKIMEIGNTGGKGLSGATHPVHQKKKK